MSQKLYSTSTKNQQNNSKKEEFTEKEFQIIADVKEWLDSVGYCASYLFFHLLGYFSTQKCCPHALAFMKVAIRRKTGISPRSVDRGSKALQEKGWIEKNPDPEAWRKNTWTFRLTAPFAFISKVNFKNLPYRVIEILNERKQNNQRNIYKNHENEQKEAEFFQQILDARFKPQKGDFVSRVGDGFGEQWINLEPSLSYKRKGMDSGFKPVLNYDFEMSKTRPGFKAYKDKPFNNMGIFYQLRDYFPEIPRDQYHYFQKALPPELVYAKERVDWYRETIKKPIINMPAFVKDQVNEFRKLHK